MFKTHPTILVLNGANWLGSFLVKLIIQNGAQVVLIDEFNSLSHIFIKEYADNKLFTFVEKAKAYKIREFIKKIHYIVNLQNNLELKDYEISSKRFLTETSFIDDILTLAVEKNARFLQVSSIEDHKHFLTKKNNYRDFFNAYSSVEIQDYIEKLVLEYVAKSDLDATILRMTEVIGYGVDLKEGGILLDIFKDAVEDNFIKITGDGLETKNYLHIEDAVRGILLTLFSEDIKGKIFSLRMPEDISILSIASKMLEFPGVRASNIRFIACDDENQSNYLNYQYIPDPSIEEIGWRPRHSIESALYDTFRFYLMHREDVDEVRDQEAVDHNYYFEGNNTHNFDGSDFVGSLEDRRIDSKKKINNEDLSISFDLSSIQDGLSKKLSNSKMSINSLSAHDDYDKFRNPPIYKPSLNNVDKNSNIVKQIKSSFNPMHVFFYVFTIVLTFWAIVFPLIKLFNFISYTDDQLKTLLEYSIDYRYEISSPRLQERFEREFYYIQVLLSLINKKNELEAIRVGFKGLDRAFEIYANNKNTGAYQLLYSSAYISSEGEYIKLKTLKQESELALSEISNLDNILILPSTKNRLEKVKRWLQYNTVMAESKISQYLAKN